MTQNTVECLLCYQLTFCKSLMVSIFMETVSDLENVGWQHICFLARQCTCALHSWNS